DIARTFDMGNGKEWTAKNYSGGFHGYITIKSALTQSSNLATMNLLNELGLSKVRKQITDMGFNDIPENVSIAIGRIGISPLDFAKFYSMFPNDGEVVVPTLIKHIETSFVASIVSAPKNKQIRKP
uniref:penicillin-binding transpeptidase domain-containing protein n=1 Tax=Campylobacter concisus TaxID=199 RepID=UPI00215668F3